MQLWDYRDKSSEEINKRKEPVEGNEEGKGIHGRGSGRTNTRTGLT